jgi:hypothetical protein
MSEKKYLSDSKLSLYDSKLKAKMASDDASTLGYAKSYTDSELEGFASEMDEALDALTSAVNGKAPSVHGHAISDVTGLQSELNSKATKDIATASTNGLMSSSDKTKLNATNIAYGTCNTAAATAAKVVTVTGNTNWVLAAGSSITVFFDETNTASNPTLNVNGTGAKNIYYGASQITTSSLGYAGTASRPMTFIYDGTEYRFAGWGYDSNTTYTNVKLGHGYATCSTAATTVAKTASLSSYTLTTGGIVAVKFTYDVPASATLNINSKGAKDIYHRGAAIKAGVIKAGDTATFIYSSRYHLLSIDREEDTTYTLNSFGVTSTADELNKLDGLTATTTELNYIDGVTSNIQTQLDAKVPSTRTINGKPLSANITLSASDIGADASGSANAVQTKLTALNDEFDDHTSNKSNPHGVTKSQVGLGNVDNTSDDSKPVSTAQATAIADAKKAGTDAQSAIDAHEALTNNPHGVTAAQVGLGNVPNVTTNNQKPTFTVASSLSALTSNDTLTTQFGKIAKAISDLIAHLANKSNPHGVTAAQVGADPAGSANAVQTNLNTLNDEFDDHTENADIHFTAAERTKLSGIATGANKYSHPNSGVTAGTYKSVTVNAQGHVTGGTNPTTLAGYGITDAEPKGTATSTVGTHNTSNSAHNDIRTTLSELNTKVNNFLNVTDTTKDQLSEIIALIEANADDIETITSGKVNVADIINNLTTNVTNKPLSAAQGVALKALIDALDSDKVDKVSGKGLSTNDYTTTEKNKLSGIAAGAEVNQNAFSNIKVGTTTVSADAKTDTVEFVGSNVTITPDATNDKVTFAVASGTTSAAGIVKLSTSTSSTSTSLAATPSAVKSAYDLANTAKTNAATAQTTADSASDAAAAAQSTADTATTNLVNHVGNTSNPHGVTAAQVGLGNVPNVTTNNQTPTYTVASSNAELKSGETMTTAFGKIAKAVSSLIAHLSNTSNPHSVTKAQVGLGNVDNTADANKTVKAAGTATTATTLSGLTATVTELNILDGVTATTAELNYVDGVTSNIQTQLNGKAASSHGTHVTYSTTAPAANGTASAGSSANVSRGDHVHPLQTTVSGNAGTATKLQTARTITLSGDASGSVSFDGSENKTLTVTVADDSHNHIISNVDGLQTSLDGKVSCSTPMTLSITSDGILQVTY